MLPLISVIIPVYNAAGFLENTLTRLAKQSYKNMEFIIVNDGSNDASAEIIEEFTKNNSRFIALNTENRGVSAARNSGIENAGGEYLMFCDADDYPESNMAERLLEASNGADITLCGFNKISAQKLKKEAFAENVCFSDKTEIAENLVMPMCVWGYCIKAKAKPAVYGSVWRGLYKKSFIDRNKISFPVGVSLGEDMLFNISAFMQADKIRIIQDCLYNYIENSASATHTDSDRLWRKYKNLHYHAHILLDKFNMSANDLLWHDYQLSRYAVSAIVEGVCSLNTDKKEKQKKVKHILQDEKLKEALKTLPKGLNEKDLLLTKALTSLPAAAILAYYQRIYNTLYFD